ncbi:MAG: penicillin-binding protein transpeptidase [Anaerocolumna sp.]|nr:penicillin-binding protein transpeptidase [Anaerocolumna sp.]
MLDILLEKIKHLLTSRFVPIIIVYILLFSVIINRIFTLQIVNGENYSEDLAVKDVRTREIKSTRGNIYDTNGVLLASNEITYAVVLSESSELTTNEARNAMLHRLIQLLEEHGNTIENEFGISIDENGGLYFNETGNAELRFKKNVYGLRSVNDLDESQINATAEEVFQYMRYGNGKYSTMFNINEKYTLEEALKIMTLRYAIYTNWPAYNQVIICSNVDDKTVAAIMENSTSLPGVEIKQQTYRYYNESIYFAHILGYTGLISGAELEELQKESDYYNSSDVIGKTGIEKEYEEYLAGTKGLEEISVSSSGKYVETLTRNDPIAGSDIYLTIDSALQKAIYQIIERNLAGILLSKINNSSSAGTRGESSSDIKIPIYDVYFALINNNIIDTKEFKEDDATALEKQVYHKFLSKQEDTANSLKGLLGLNSTALAGSQSEEMQEYLSYIYSDVLIDNDILVASSINTSDEKFIQYKNDEISLSQFLQYAIASNWVDLTKLNIGDQYYSTAEIYDILIETVFNLLKNDDNFDKKLYNYLIYSYKLSGTEICLLLYDQNVIKYNKEDKEKLEKGIISAYTFITDKIRKLEITPAQLALDPCSASVVVTDVNTGEVRALVSYPSYDNNKLANKIDSQYYSQLNSDLTTPLYHRATKQKTAPGSTFKMVSSVAILEEGAVGPTETIYDHLVFDRIALAPRCWSTTSHGAVDITKALEVSCNYFYYEASWRLGLDENGVNNDQLGLQKLSEYASLFGFNEKSGIELEESDPHISDEDSIRSAIGQGSHAYTPVQIARYVTTVANSGTLFDLTILDRITDKENKTLLESDQKVVTLDNISDTTWNLVHEGMYKVGNGQNSSSYHTLHDIGITVAGKTGTAQESKFKPNHALFVSYAPYNNPEISIATVIPNGYSSSTAVELTKDIYSYYFDLEDAEVLTDSPADLLEGTTNAISD